MFTGIIEELGQIQGLTNIADGARITIAAELVTSDAAEGDSIAVNGVCLTALDITSGSFSADVSGETLDRTTLSRLKTSSKVNLERAVTPTTRLGGHIVQGHVDGVGRFLGGNREGDFYTVKIGFPNEMAQYFVYKGSVSVEGISLTIASLESDFFTIAVIPKTWEMTNLSTLTDGDAVNLEADVIAKYVERILSVGKESGKKVSITTESLKALGY